MKKTWCLVCWFYFISILYSFGQEIDTLQDYSKNHFVFINLAHLIDPNGSALQFGLNYQYKPWLDLQLELGFVSDNLTQSRLPFSEYAGFRIRPQIRFTNKYQIYKSIELYAGLMVSYQQLNFKENNDFNINNNFFQNITYNGLDKTFGWYVTGGLDFKTKKRLIVNISAGIGQVRTTTKVDEGDIPENATIINNCFLFCGRRRTLNQENNRPGAIIELRLGYMF